MTKDELIQHFENYKKYIDENNLEKEFSNLIFLNKKSALEEFDALNNPKREYIRELLDKYINM